MANSSLIGGIYFMVLHSKKSKSLFCGIDIHTEEGMERIRNSIAQLVEEAHSLAKEQKGGDKS